MTVAISSTAQIAAGTPCILIGAIIMLSSLAVNEKSKSGFIAMITIGAVLFAAGLVLLLFPVKPTDKPQPPSPALFEGVPAAKAPLVMPVSANPVRSAMKGTAAAQPPASLMFGMSSNPMRSAIAGGDRESTAAFAPPSPSHLSPGKHSIRWKNDDALESVKEFKLEEAPKEIARLPVHVQAAHEPKAVPAVPTKRLTRRLGYESASVPAPIDSQQFMANSFQTSAQSDSALTGGYTRLSPLDDTVESRLRERQEFEAFRDSDTLEAQKHRRYALLQEAAWSQPMISRDGLIPILGPNGEDLTQGRCNSIVANSV